MFVAGVIWTDMAAIDEVLPEAALPTYILEVSFVLIISINLVYYFIQLILSFVIHQYLQYDFIGSEHIDVIVC